MLFIVTVGIANVAPIKTNVEFALCTKSWRRRSQSWGDSVAVSALGWFQLHEWSALSLLNGSAWLQHSLLIAALPFISSLSLSIPLTLSRSLSPPFVLSKNRHRHWTWNRRHVDDAPEVLGSGFLSLSLQITGQINMLALTDPEQVKPPGIPYIALACHHWQCSVGRAAFN